MFSGTDVRILLMLAAICSLPAFVAGCSGSGGGSNVGGSQVPAGQDPTLDPANDPASNVPK